MASFLQNSGYSVPIASIAAYYVFSIIPHVYAVSIASQGNPSTIDNANPRSTDSADKIRKKLGPYKFAAFERAEACHRNHLENQPLFFATVIIGWLAEERLKSPALGNLTPEAAASQIGLSTFVLAWFTVRTLYTFNYITTTSQTFAAVRSLLYFTGTGLAFNVLIRAARALSG